MPTFGVRSRLAMVIEPEGPEGQIRKVDVLASGRWRSPWRPERFRFTWNVEVR